MFGMSRIKGCGPAGDDTTSYEFADAGEYEVGDVAYVYTIEGGGATDAVIDRKEKLTPTDASEPECKRTCSHGQKDEFPSAASELLNKILPLHFAKRHPQKKGGKDSGCSIFQYLLYIIFHFSHFEIVDTSTS